MTHAAVDSVEAAVREKIMVWTLGVLSVLMTSSILGGVRFAQVSSERFAVQEQRLVQAEEAIDEASDTTRDVLRLREQLKSFQDRYERDQNRISARLAEILAELRRGG